MSELLRDLGPDGLCLPTIKEHSIEQIRKHNYFVRTFATAMKLKWPQRAYLGLYSGAGRARLAPSGEIIETTAMSALRIPDPFTKYNFVDQDSTCTNALADRIRILDAGLDTAVLTGDVNLLIPRIREEMPRFSRDKGLLSFCFVDPFAADLRFSTVRALSAYKMDFLILLMLGVDARMNFRRYLEDENDTRIAELIDDEHWREDYRQSGDRHVVRYILRRFDQAMVSLGYRSADVSDVSSVRIARKNVFLYNLVFYSKHELGSEFWKAAQRGTSQQLGFEL